MVGCSSPEPAPAPPTGPAAPTADPALTPADPAPATSTTSSSTSAPATETAATAAEEHCRLGMQCLNEGRLDDAVQAFTRAIELAPADAFPLAARALARNQLGDGEAAVEDVSAAIALARADEGFVLDLYAFRGSVCTELQRWAAGEADLTRCVESGKDEVELRLSRGTCLLELGQLERALADAEAVVARAPDEDARGRGLWLRGLVHERAGRLEAALADLEAAAEAGNTHSADDLARVRAALGR